MTQNITIELTAIDLHLLDRSIDSFNICEYIEVDSAPHNFEAVLLCKKQTLNLLKPDSDSLTLGYTYSTFTEINNKSNMSVSKIIKSELSSVSYLSNKVESLNNTVIKLNETTAKTISHNNSETCILVSFELLSAAFTSGQHTSDVSTYIPENYTLVSCIAQLTNLSNEVITSVSISGTTLTFRAYNMNNGTVNTNRDIRCLCICQKIEREEV